MPGSLPFRIRPAEESLLGRWLARHEAHPETFRCGVRVTEGTVAGEGPRWQFRRSAADPLVLDGVITLNHATTTLRVRPEPAPFPGVTSPRASEGHVVFAAAEVATGAALEISVRVDELARFGLEPP